MDLVDVLCRLVYLFAVRYVWCYVHMRQMVGDTVCSHYYSSTPNAVSVTDPFPTETYIVEP